MEIILILGLWFLGWQYFWPRQEGKPLSKKAEFIVLFLLFGGIYGIAAIWQMAGKKIRAMSKGE